VEEKRNEFTSPEQKKCRTWQIGFCGVSTQDTGFSSISVAAAIIFVPLLLPHSDAIKRYRFTWAIQ
jgi:hypothetical protein